MQTFWRWAGLGLLALFGVGCAVPARPSLRFHEEVTATLPGRQVQSVDIPRLRIRLAVDPYPFLTEKDVAAAKLVPTQGGLAVALEFTPHGRTMLEEATLRGRNDHLVVFLEGRPVAAWLVDKPLRTGQFLLEGDFTDDEAKKLVDGLTQLAKEQSRP